MINLLFSYHGRINRAKFWLGTFSLLAVLAVIILIFVLLDLKNESHDPTTAEIIIASIGGLIFLVTLYCHTCLGIKRFYDRDKSGVWILVQFVPAIGSLWYFVETGFLKGTEGANQFGEDSLMSSPVLARA